MLVLVHTSGILGSLGDSSTLNMLGGAWRRWAFHRTWPWAGDQPWAWGRRAPAGSACVRRLDPRRRCPWVPVVAAWASALTALAAAALAVAAVRILLRLLAPNYDVLQQQGSGAGGGRASRACWGPARGPRSNLPVSAARTRINCTTSVLIGLPTLMQSRWLWTCCMGPIHTSAVRDHRELQRRTKPSAAAARRLPRTGRRRRWRGPLWAASLGGPGSGATGQWALPRQC